MAHETETRPHVLGLTADELAERLGDARLAERVYRGLWQHGAADTAELRRISKRRRPAIEAAVASGLPRVIDRVVHRDGSRKLAFALEDGAVVEAVVLPRHERWTVCLSSQAGCGLACRFCATGKLGLRRNLEAHEITGQLLAAQREIGRRIGGVVFMGMGEPLQNEAAVFRACRIFGETIGAQIGPRRIMISTAGLVPAIRRYARSSLRMPLVFSLGAAVPEKRARLMPVQAVHGFEALLDAIREYAASRGGRHVTLEYVAIKNLTMGEDDVAAIREHLRGFRFILDVIPWNPVPGVTGFEAPSRAEVQAWTERLRPLGFPVKLRQSFGQEGGGGCGQLGSRLLAAGAPGAGGGLAEGAGPG